MAEAEPEPGAMLAAIDIGTNSLHLVVARAVANGGIEVVATDKATIRLGEGADDRLSLNPDAIGRGVEALDRFTRIADSYDATIKAVATSAVREAPNGADFVELAHAEAGLDVAVISGVEEARLIHLGVLAALPVFDKPILVVDIGGGSTEFVAGRGTQIDAARSLRIGHVRLTDRFFPGGVVEPAAISACRRFLRSFLEPARQAVGVFGHDVAVGCSGTIGAVAAIESALIGDERDRPSVTSAGLHRVVEAVVSHPTAIDRAAVPGLEERRRDVIVGGALLLEAVFAVFGIDEMVLSPFALREGVLLDEIQRQHGTGLRHLSRIRQASVERMIEAFDEPLEIVGHCTDLSLQLFDDFAPAHGLDERAREVLETAALLHNVGVFISHAAHHKHSYYVIRYSDRLLGFSEREIELIAQVARYHRKAHPTLEHPAFAALSESDRALVATCAGILRIGIALDRSRRQLVESVSVVADDTATFRVCCVVPSGADVGLELYTAQERSDLFAATLGARVSFEERTRDE